MSILEKEVIIRLHTLTVNYYEGKGYDIPKKIKNGILRVDYKSSILVKVEDLPNGSNLKVTKVCDDCGKKMPNRQYASIISSREKTDGKDRCVKCGALYANKIIKENIPYEKSLEYYAKENNMQYLLDEFSPKNTVTLDKVFRASNDDLYWNCKKCGSEFIQSPSLRTCYSCNCPYCAGQKVNETNSLSSLFPEITLEWHPTKNKKMSPNDLHYGSSVNAWWKCKEGHEWKARISTRTKRNYGYPTCAESKGEKRIRKWLEENNIKFIPQKEFEGLVGLGGGNLSYDFYLPEYNLLIEYQGEFHDGKQNEYVRQNLDYRQEHDNRKRIYTQRNNINLLEIWYWDFDNIEDILSKKL